jgi:uracil-DNA glycosylase
VTFKILICGEAWGAEEEKARAPFIGASGQELTRMLDEAGIRRADCYLTNVFNMRPENNDLENICVPKGQGSIEGMPALKAGKYPRAELRSELIRLHRELQETNSNVVLALGGTACWALLAVTGISKIRGTVTGSPGTIACRANQKVLPTYHPAAVLRDWSLRAVTVLDLAKAKRESEFPEIRRPERTVYIEPDLDNIDWFIFHHLMNAKMIAIDIETRGNQITCIGFAPSASVAITIPFVDERKPGNSYWPTLEQEAKAWKRVRAICASPAKKLFQNGLYDLNFMWTYGIKVNNAGEDTMLLHHALQPESEKGLGFLGSVYSNEQSWKLLNRKTTTIKRDA